MRNIFEEFYEKTVQIRGIGAEEANDLYEAGRKEPFLLMAYANRLRDHFKGETVSLCAIVNAKSGICPENCRFCAQSAHYHTDAPVYPLISSDEIVAGAREAYEGGARYFGIVTSGTSVADDEEWNVINDAITRISRMGMRPCASLGLITEKNALRMKEAGLYRYHHNLETARSNFHNICTTHEYDEDIATAKTAKAAGLSVCCGGIIGLGETMAQRIEMALTIGDIGADSVPINILNPIAGTPMMGEAPLTPLEILLTVSLYRFILPDKDIKLCGGKERNLRQLLPLSIVAGANSLMTGNYLTTLGRDASHDLEMIRDLGLTPQFE
jgi:biotin synthase